MGIQFIVVRTASATPWLPVRVAAPHLAANPKRPQAADRMAEESELVAGDVVAEVMEREAPVESPAEEPRGWFSWLLGPRRESGAETNADASKPEPKQAGGNARGSVEFLGLWKENTKKYKRLMPIKIQAVLYYRPSCGRDNNHLRVRAALSKLVDELVRNKMSSGILTISSWEEHFGDNVGSVTVWGISWSASPNDKSYQQLGLSSMLPDQKENIRFADFDGAIRSLGYWGENAKYQDPKDRPSNIAVYRVTLPSGGLDRSKWAGRPPPPAPDLRTGPRSDGLLSTDEISGEYSGRCFFPVSCCNSMTVAPVGPDVIEMRTSGCISFPCLGVLGPWVGGKVRFRRPGTNEFGAERSYGTNIWTFSADETTQTAKGGCCEYYKKRPGSQAPGKVETRDLAGTWCGWAHFAPLILAFACEYWGLSCTTKKVLNEDQYAESGCRSLLCVPIPVCDTRTRLYVHGHATNGFAKDGSIDWCCTLLKQSYCCCDTKSEQAHGGADLDDIDWYHDPGYARKKGEIWGISLFSKKIC